MEPVDYIALAIPVFFALIGLELLVARWRGERLYRLNDSLADLGTGVLQQVLGVFIKALLVGSYAWVWERYRVTELPAGAWWTWLLCFLGVDFLYYWFHRISHESNLPWGAHIVHHSSEEYNLAVALRQGAFQPLFSFGFYLPLAWLGFPPLVFLACSAWDTLYQFWIHTKAIKTLGPLEWVLNTPSHHRVHHGCNDKYIDKNYAGTLIVWDRLFGTFQPEEEEVIYGITKPLRSWNPLWANIHHYVDTVERARGAPSWGEWFKVWFKPPGWSPDWMRSTVVDGPTPLNAGEAGKYDPKIPRRAAVYATVHFLAALLVAVLMLDRAAAWTLPLALAVAGWVAWTLLCVGAIFDDRRWAWAVEGLRIVASLAGLVTYARQVSYPISLWALAAGTVGIGAWAIGYGIVCNPRQRAAFGRRR